MDFSPVESGAIVLFSDQNPKKRTSGKRKIDIKRIDNLQSRMVCFSKRRQGLFKKAGDLASLSGADIAIVVRSQADRFYTYGSASFDSTVDRFLSDNGGEIETANQSLAAVIDGDSTQWRPLVSFDVDSCDHVGELESFLYQEERRGDTSSKSMILVLFWSPPFDFLSSVPGRLLAQLKFLKLSKKRFC